MNKKIKIAADSKIPFLKGVLEPFSEVKYLDPLEITKEEIQDTDALIIRTRTRCDSSLLDGTKVKFIATATIGYDHIDQSYCDQNNIRWINAPGCNSSSVMQYMAAALLTLAKEKSFNLADRTIGIIGIGNVGSKVAKLAEIFGMKVLCNDPPRERIEGNLGFVSLDEIISKSDIITFHVPLIKEGIDKTFHMADESFFAKLKKGMIIINTARGQVINTSALKDAIKRGIVSGAILDVLENEPNIDLELLELVDIATPHIAGYSVDGKANGTSVCVKAVSEFFGFGITQDWYPQLPEPLNPTIIDLDFSGKSNQEIFYDAVSAAYNIREDDARLRNSPETFENQRGNYPVRFEFPHYKIKLDNLRLETVSSLQRLGFKIIS